MKKHATLSIIPALRSMLCSNGKLFAENFNRKLIMAFTIAGFLSLSNMAHATVVPIIAAVQSTNTPSEHSPTDVFALEGNNVGWSFTVGASGITITNLGLYDSGGDGLAEAHQVGIWNSSGTLLASTTIPSGTTATLAGGYRYSSISPPLALFAGQSYVIGALYVASSSDNFIINSSQTIASQITFNASLQTQLTFSSGYTPPFGEPNFNSGAHNQGFFGPNFEFTTGCPPYSPTISGNLPLCPGSSITLDAGAGYASYIWSSGATSQTISANSAGTYTVSVTIGNGCSGSSSVTVNNAVVDDNNACTTDACDPSTGNVTHSLVDCNDHNACTQDVCDPVQGCTYTLINLDDNNACTTDGCDPIQGATHTPVSTDDGNPCTTDACDPSTGDISHTNNGVVIPIGPITGTYVNNCLQLAGYNGLPYTIPAVAGATYHWTVPAGMVIVSGQGTNSISVNISQTSMHLGVLGQMCVDVKSGCDSGSTCTTIELQVVKPVAPGSITGPAKVCPGDVVVYSVTAVSRASYYQWSVPTGMTIINGNNTNAITVQVDVNINNTFAPFISANFTGGTISVQAGNVCGISAIRSKAVALNYPGLPAVITGPANGVCGLANVGYSTSGAVAATSYQWSASGGASVSGGQGTANAMVNFPNNFTSGAVIVYGVNGCGNGPSRLLNVVGKPAVPVSISGPVAGVCTGVATPYSVALVPGATTYVWSKPATATLNFQGSNNVTITFAATGNQTISVKTTNGCGTSGSRALVVNVVSCAPRLGDEDLNSAINVYPNPAHDQLTVSFTSDKTADMVMTLNDIIGRTVLTANKTVDEGINTYQLDLTKVSKGLYLLQTEIAGKKETVKVVVE